MGTMILWRPLIFGDEEQILEIKKQEIEFILMWDSAMKSYKKEIRKAEAKISEAEEEMGNICHEAEKELLEIYNRSEFLQQYTFNEVKNKFYISR